MVNDQAVGGGAGNHHGAPFFTHSGRHWHWCLGIYNWLVVAYDKPSTRLSIPLWLLITQPSPSSRVSTDCLMDGTCRYACPGVLTRPLSCPKDIAKDSSSCCCRGYQQRQQQQ